MLQLDAQQIVSQALSFLILLWVLKRVAWRPLLQALAARRAHIEGELDKVAKSRQDLERLQEDYARRLAQIEDEARRKIQEAIVEGKRIAVEIQEEARAQAHRIITKSREAVELELAKAKVTLRDQLTAMTIEAVQRILGQKLDEKSDRRLVEAALEELEHVPISTGGASRR